MNRIWQYLQSAEDKNRDPLRSAWKKVEQDLRDIHGVGRYATFHSFRTGKHKKPRRARLR